MLRSIELGKGKRRKQTPEQKAILAARPDIDDGAMRLARAFRRLSTCRPQGMGYGPIPATAIWQWQDREGITEPSLRAFTEAVIINLDVGEL